MTDKDIFAQLRQLADEAAARKTDAQPLAPPAGTAAGGLRIEDLVGAAKTAREEPARTEAKAGPAGNKDRSGS